MRRSTTFLFVWVCFFASTWLHGKNAVIRSQANVPVEITFGSATQHHDPFNMVQVDVLFTDTQGATQLVPAFWGGGNIWKVRFASPTTGNFKWRTECSDTSDAGLHNITGTVQVSRYRGTNPLFQHGPIEVAADKRHFQHADGTPFFWLGDTWWMGLCHRLHWPDEFQQLAADRKEKGFNVIQIVAGLYPDMHPFDPRGANENGFPWETNYVRIRPQYFDAADTRLRYLIDQGFTPCIVGAWGYFLPWMGVEKAKQHWRELIARYGSWPVVWCVAGEANLPWYLAKGFPYDDRELVHGWTEVARYIRATDPFHRPLTIHPTGIGKLNSRWAIDDASLLDFDMLQTPHGQREAVAPTVAAFNHAYTSAPAMPVLDGEASYEMLNGQIEARWSRAMFWLCMMSGAAGHTYGANGIWQCNRRDQPHGASPHGGNYGSIPWDEAMHLPGSKQIGDAKKFLQKFPWDRCLPQPNSVSWDDESPKQWGNWIWFPEGNPTIDAPVEKRFFRRAFDLPPSSKWQSATLRVAADDRASVWLNGKKLGEVAGWQTPSTFNVTDFLQPKQNVLAIEAENLSAPVKANPASLMAVIELEFQNETQTIVSDAEWRVAKKNEQNWQSVSFSDSSWAHAAITARHGGGPWGRIGESDPAFVPYALGIGDNLKIIYALMPRPLLVSGLLPRSHYVMTPFDSVTGKASKGSIVRTNEKGQWLCPAPSQDHDWVIVLERK